MRGFFPNLWQLAIGSHLKLRWLIDHFFLLMFLLGLLVIQTPAGCGTGLNCQFQHHLMESFPTNRAFAVSVMGNESHIHALDLNTGGMKKHLLTHGNQSMRCSPKGAFHFWMLVPAVFHFHLMSLCSGVKQKQTTCSAEILCITLADMFCTISSHSARFLHIHHHSHMSLFSCQTVCASDFFIALSVTLRTFLASSPRYLTGFSSFN